MTARLKKKCKKALTKYRWEYRLSDVAWRITAAELEEILREISEELALGS